MVTSLSFMTWLTTQNEAIGSSVLMDHEATNTIWLNPWATRGLHVGYLIFDCEIVKRKLSDLDLDQWDELEVRGEA